MPLRGTPPRRTPLDESAAVGAVACSGRPTTSHRATTSRAVKCLKARPAHAPSLRGARLLRLPKLAEPSQVRADGARYRAREHKPHRGAATRPVRASPSADTAPTAATRR